MADERDAAPTTTTPGALLSCFAQLTGGGQGGGGGEGVDEDATKQ